MSESKNMAIYHAIAALEEYIENCPSAVLSTTKISVVYDELMSLINDISISLPEDISRAQAILTEAESYIDAANNRANEIIELANTRATNLEKRAKAAAQEIIEDAKLQKAKLVSENEVLITAQKEAKELIESTQQDCIEVYESAKVEADELLREAEVCLNACLNRVVSDRERIGARPERTRTVTEADTVENVEEQQYTEQEEFEEKPRTRTTSAKQGNAPKPQKRSFITWGMSEEDDDDTDDSFAFDTEGDSGY